MKPSPPKTIDPIIHWQSPQLASFENRVFPAAMSLWGELPMAAALPFSLSFTLCKHFC
ncbi:MAG: hypothetical protein H7X89_14895 [Rhizobiales bacterium]|nr:hypothetical protein [Hyphomicrobiales bacterium]